MCMLYVQYLFSLPTSESPCTIIDHRNPDAPTEESRNIINQPIARRRLRSTRRPSPEPPALHDGLTPWTPFPPLSPSLSFLGTYRCFDPDILQSLACACSTYPVQLSTASILDTILIRNGALSHAVWCSKGPGSERDHGQ